MSSLNVLSFSTRHITEVEMEFFNSQIIAYFASCFVVCGFLIASGRFINSNVNELAISNTSDWLKNISFNQRFSVFAESFSKAFDSIFGKNLISFNAFTRSCLISFLTYMVLFHFMLYVVFDASWNDSDVGIMGGLGLLLAPMVYNFIPDYLSLIESKYIIKKISHYQKTQQIIYWLVLDVIFTAIIFFTCFMTVLLIVSVVISWQSEYETVFGLLDELMTFNFGRNPVNDAGTAIFYTTFFTSIWIYLYLLSSLLLKLIPKATFISNMAIRYLKVESEPFVVLSIGACLVTIVFYIIGAPFVLFNA